MENPVAYSPSSTSSSSSSFSSSSSSLGSSSDDDDDENNNDDNDNSDNEAGEGSDNDGKNDDDGDDNDKASGNDSDTNSKKKTSKSTSRFSAADLTLGSCLMQDLRLCQQDDPYLFCFLLPFVCSKYLLPNYMINNSDLVYLIVSCIDPRQMRDLRSSILSEDIVLFKEPPNFASQIAPNAGNGKAKSNAKNNATSKTAGGKQPMSASQGKYFCNY